MPTIKEGVSAAVMHLNYWLRKNKEKGINVLKLEANEVFINFFKKYVKQTSYFNNSYFIRKNIKNENIKLELDSQKLCVKKIEIHAPSWVSNSYKDDISILQSNFDSLDYNALHIGSINFNVPINDNPTDCLKNNKIEGAEFFKKTAESIIEDINNFQFKSKL